MLVEINLLPKRDTKNYIMLTILLIAIVLFLIAGMVLLWQGKTLERQLATVDNQLQTTERLVQIEQEKRTGGLEADDVATLEAAVVWASEDVMKAVPVIQHVTGLLPERGFIQSIAYDDSGSVNLTVQFDTSRESAYYLKTLLDSEWLSTVNLSGLSTNNLASEENEDVIPRYIGQFQLQLNRDFIQAERKQVAESGGGAAS